MNQESRNAGTGQESALTHLEAPEDFSAVYGCASVKISVHLWPKLSCFPAFLIDPVLGNMNDEPDDTDRSLASEKKIEQAIRSIGSTVKSAATDTETAHPDLATPVNVEQR